MSKVVTIRVPEWVDEKKLREIINRALAEISPRIMSIDKLREILGVEELEEEISDDVYVREKEKERVKWLY
ncbi:hypothetical protein E3E31_11760 [Thermococcus sp. M39]|uniref:hypothetical protein n=1 Tax=unclassified Thermococcus TaxID=2627626 RepID=UPI00143C728A|nr:MULTISPECIES: hypothetical protein [unclassified Thermococcus]NJE09186.1 hypothetical protein [Thermococcus sp. M39]NJE13105.1 hypothetical protein [Thermococcus sp. LS2]